MSTGSIKTVTLNEFYQQHTTLNRLDVLPLDTIICGDNCCWDGATVVIYADLGCPEKAGGGV